MAYTQARRARIVVAVCALGLLGAAGSSEAVAVRAETAPVPPDGTSLPGAARQQQDVPTAPCLDFDGDGWGNPGQADCPMGPATDCHDGRADIHPGAPEQCDGLDNDCNEAVDDVLTPEPVNSLTLDPPSPSEVHFAWTPLPGPYVYDIVRGDLGTLRSSGGNYAVATTACVISGFAYGGYISWNSGGPSVGEGDWFMIRATCGGVHGTYDEYSPGQAGLRDAEIGASGLDCP